MEKPDEEKEGNGQSDFLAYTGAIGAAIFLGLADYLASLLATLGLSGIFAEWFGCIMAWGCYHVYCLVYWMAYHEDHDTHYFTKAKSMYYEVDDSDVADQKTPAKPAENGDIEDEHHVYSRQRGKSLRIPHAKSPAATAKYKFSVTKTFGMFTRFFFQLAI